MPGRVLLCLSCLPRLPRLPRAKRGGAEHGGVKCGEAIPALFAVRRLRSAVPSAGDCFALVGFCIGVNLALSFIASEAHVPPATPATEVGNDQGG